MVNLPKKSIWIRLTYLMPSKMERKSIWAPYLTFSKMDKEYIVYIFDAIWNGEKYSCYIVGAFRNGKIVDAVIFVKVCFVDKLRILIWICIFEFVFWYGYVYESKYMLWYGNGFLRRFWAIKSESRVSNIDKELLYVIWITLCTCIISCSLGCDDLNLCFPCKNRLVNVLVWWFINICVDVYVILYGHKSFTIYKNTWGIRKCKVMTSRLKISFKFD